MISAIVVSPIGPLTLVASDAGLHEIRFPQRRSSPSVSAAQPSTGAGPEAQPEHAALAAATRQLHEYFAGTRRTFDLPLAPSGTAFQLAAWHALTAIPYAETVSYADQARRLGDGRKARAVGAANGRNPLPIVVPCHRVIGTNGSLTGFGGGIETKAWLLDHERSVAGLRLPL